MNRIITFFVCFALFYTFFTPIRAFANGGEALTLLIPVVLIFVMDKMYLRHAMLWATIVLIIVFLFGISGVEYFKAWIVYSITLLFAVFAFEHYMIRRDPEYLKFVLLTAFGSVLLLTVASIPQFIMMPSLSRYMKIAAEENTELQFEYFWTVSYSTIHSIPVLSVPFFALYSSSKKKIVKVFAGMCVGAMVLVMFFADATTPLLLMVATVAFFIIYNHRHSSGKNFAKFALIGILIIPFLSRTGVSFMLTAIQPFFEGSSNFKKVEELAYYANSGQTSGDMESRENLYNISVETILQNPLLPNTDSKAIGHHSHMIDHIAVLGLFLFVPYVFFLYERYKRPRSLIPHFRMYYSIAFFSMIALSLAKNFMVLSSACFLVPLFLIKLEQLHFKK